MYSLDFGPTTNQSTKSSIEIGLTWRLPSFKFKRIDNAILPAEVALRSLKYGVSWLNFSGLLIAQSLHYPGCSPKKKRKKATPFLSIWYKKTLANANTSTKRSAIFMFALLIYKCLHKSMMVAQRHHLLKKLPCRCVCSWSCGICACIEEQPGGTLSLWSLWNACTSEGGGNRTAEELPSFCPVCIWKKGSQLTRRPLHVFRFIFWLFCGRATDFPLWGNYQK